MWIVQRQVLSGDSFSGPGMTLGSQHCFLTGNSSPENVLWDVEDSSPPASVRKRESASHKQILGAQSHWLWWAWLIHIHLSLILIGLQIYQGQHYPNLWKTNIIHLCWERRLGRMGGERNQQQDTLSQLSQALYLRSPELSNGVSTVRRKLLDLLDIRIRSPKIKDTRVLVHANIFKLFMK